MPLPTFTPGFRLIDGSDLNKIVAVVGSSAPVDGLADGTAAAPALAFATDTNTGLFSSAANVLGIAANGSSVGTFDANGYNGKVGGTTPAAGAFSTLSSSSNVDHTGAVFAFDNIATGLTAHVGGGQGSALALTKLVNVVSTVGSAADSVALPAPTTVGQVVIVVNGAAANSMQVFGAGTDTINGVATGTGVAQAAGKTGIFIAATTGAGAAWWRVLSA